MTLSYSRPGDAPGRERAAALGDGRFLDGGRYGQSAAESRERNKRDLVCIDHPMLDQADFDVAENARHIIGPVTKQDGRVGQILILHYQRTVEEVLATNVRLGRLEGHVASEQLFHGCKVRGRNHEGS